MAKKKRGTYNPFADSRRSHESSELLFQQNMDYLNEEILRQQEEHKLKKEQEEVLRQQEEILRQQEEQEEYYREEAQKIFDNNKKAQEEDIDFSLDFDDSEESQKIKSELDKISANALMEDIQKKAQQEPQSQMEASIKELSPDVDLLSYREAKKRFNELHEKTFLGVRDKVRKDNDSLRYDVDDFWGGEKSGFKNEAKRIGNFLYDVSNFVTGIVEVPSAYLSSDRLTDDESREYDKLKKVIEDYERPVAETYIENINNQIETLKETYGIRDRAWYGQALGLPKTTSDVVSGETLRDVRNTIDALEDAKDLWEDNRDGAGFWSGMAYNADNSLSLGIKDMSRDVGTALIAEKVDNGWDITEEEKLRLEAYKTLEEAKGMSVDPNSWYSSGQSLTGTIGFVLEMYASGGIVGTAKSGVKKKIAKELGESIAKSNIGRATTFVAETMLMPTTHKTAADSYLSDNMQRIVNAEGETELIISNAAREFAYKDLKNVLNEEEKKIAELELALENGQIPKDSEKGVREELNKLYDVRDYINSQLSQISEKDGSVKKNSSMLKAGLEGFRNTASEKIIEKTVGKYVDVNFTPAIGSYLRKADNFLHNYTLNKGVPKSSTKLFTKEEFSNIVGKGKVGTMTKAIWHSIKPGEIIQSPLGEFVEEGVIQFVPSLYGGVDGYYDQIDELSNPVFWGNVALGSVVLSGGRGAVQGFSTYVDYKGKSDREKVEVRQHLRDLSALKEFRNRVERSDNEQLMQDIAMNTYGTFFHPSDYSGRISQLRNPKYNPGDGSTLEERKDMADKIEKTSYINMALKSIKTGTDADLKQVLQKKLNDRRTPEETKHHIQYAINKLDNYRSIINNNRNLVNGSHITNLQINKDIKEEGIKDIEKELQKLNSQDAWNDLSETYNRAGIPLPENVTDIQSFFNNLSTIVVNPVPDVESDNTTQVMDLMYAKKLLEDDIKFLDKNLKYETNPANLADITKREKNIIEGLQKRTEEFEKEEAVLGLLVNPAPLNEEFFIEEVDEIVPGHELSYGGETFQIQEDGSLTDSDGNVIADELQEEIMSGANTDPLLDALLPEELIKSPSTIVSNLDSAISEQEEIIEEEGKDFGKKFFARQANQKPVSEQAKEAANNYINDLEKRLGKTPTFEDVIIDHIETYGYERTEDRFNAYEKVFKSVGMDTSKSTNIYDKYFNTIGTLDSFIEEQLDDVVAEDTQNVVETITTKQEEEVKKITTPERKFKPEMNEVVSEVSDVIAEDRKTLNPVAKFAYNFQDVSYDENTDSWSVNSRTLKPIQDNDVVDNRFILDSDFMYRIRKEPNSIKVQIYDNPDQPVKGKTFGELKQLAEKEYGKDSAQYKEWYRNNVPMVITYTGKESNNQPVPLATVHSVDWYRPATISDREGIDKQQEVINEGKENTIRLRQSVLDNGSVVIQLRNNPDNTFGQLHKIKPGTQPMSLNESNPESTIAILDASGEFRTGNKTYFDGIIVNKEQYNRDYPTNSIAYISQVGTNNNGKPIYIAIRTMNESPVAKDNLKQNLNEKVYNNIKYAILASTVLRNKNNASVLQRIEQVYKINLSKATEIADAIKNSVGIDIENQGVARFVNMFTMTNYSNIVSGKGMQGIISANNLPNGITYFNSNQDGSLGFIKKGSSTQYDSRVNVQKTVGQMPGTTVNNSRILNDLADLLDPEFGVLHQVKMNIDLKSLDATKGKELPIFDANGNVASSQSLESIYKDYLKTNIISHKIETIDGKEKYITDVQPMYYFDELGRTKEQTSQSQSTEQQKAEIKRRIQEVENFVNQDFFANSELLSNHWKTKKDLFENKIKQLKSLLQKGIKTGEDLRTLTNLLNDIRGILNEGININDETPILTNEKNIQELANSLFSLISDDVIKDYIQVMDKAMESRIGSNAVEKMLVGYSDGSGYTIDGKNVEYFLSKETLENVKNNKQINAKYDAELAALEQQSQQEIKKEVIIRGTKEKINAINNSNLTPEQKQIAIGIILGNAKGNTIFGSRQRLTAQQFSSLNTNNIDGITNEEQKEIIETLKNLVIDSIDFNSENLKYSDIKHEIENSVDKFILQQIEKNEDIITALGTIEGMEDVVSSINTVNEKLNTILNQQEKITGNNGILIKEFNNMFAVDFKEDVENIDENEENFSQSFLEKDIKLSYSAFLKMSFFAIPKDLTLGTNKNAFGFTQYHNADVVNGKLLDITTKIPSNWNVLIDNIEEMGVRTNQSLYSSMSERFKNLPEHLKNELLYNTIGKQNTIYKVLNKPGKSNYIKNKEGRDVFVVSNNEITILDENSNKDVRRIFTQLRNNFLASNYIVNKDGQLQYDKNKLNELQHNLNEIIKSKPKNVEAIKQALSLFNIEGFSDDTIQYMIDLTVQNPIKGIYGESGFMTVLSKNLKSVLNSNTINLVEDFNIIDESASSIRKVVNVEVMLHKTFMGGSIYVGGKTMQSFISNTSIYDINQKLSSISDKSYVDMLRSIPYTSKNYILEALSKDERFTEMYKEIGFSSPEAYKVKDKSMPDIADFDKIAEQDNIATVMGLYMNIKGAELDKNFRLDNHSTLEFRKGQMPVHTISDKGRMVYLTTLLLNLKQNDITFEGDTLELKQEVVDFLREQIFESEFERIVQSYQQNTNIVGYDVASKAFLLMPSLNSIEIETGNGPVNIHDILNQLANGMEIPEGVMTEIRNKADEKIKEYIQAETNEKLTSDGKGILADFNFYDNSVDDKYSLTNLNTKYVKSKPGNTNLDKLRFVSAEFAINNLLHNISTQQLYLGDLAYYSKDKFIPSKTITTKEGVNVKVPDGSKLSDANTYGNMLVSIGSNLQKRTALLIAPGKKIADSENILSSYAQNYIHIALNDTESMSSSMKELIESQYGLFDETKNNAWNKIEYYKNKISQLEGSDNPVHKKQINRMSKAIKELVNDNFSDIKDYFNITGTDAQEYTTWKTHLDMLLRQGKITRQQHDNFKNKIESEELTSDEIDVIMQPVKPVHTGMIYDNKNNIMRPIYIKASSFPLLPQMTKNLKIDGLRQSMENLENKRNMPVQVSYQSANKIGALDTKLSAEDFYNTDLSALENNGLLDSGLTVLPYSDYKIQQETPSKEQKFYKKGKDSHVIMGSQFFKILFGNFLNHYDKPVFDNRFTPEILAMAGIENVSNTGKLTGEQMYDIYENVYFKYSDALKFQLESELGLEDRDFNEESVENQNNIIDKLHKLLEREITSRNYPDYLTDSINIIEQDGRKMLESVLLFDSNRYKFESLLQAIISNRLITHTLPGNGHISASSNGFERKVELDALSDNERAGIIWINGYQSELKATVLTREDGKKVLQKSQVLIKSHWKYTDANGNFKYVNLSDPKYTEDIVENEVVVGKKLNMDMIDKELLEMFSYRIPTSSHQSGAIIEVAGFLPSEMQDLLIVPKEHTTQFGEDYDIDKRQVYKYNYYVNKSGKIRKLNGDILNSDENVDNLLTAIFGERYSEIKDFSNDYKEAEKQIKLLENAFIDVYLSVYSTLDKTIQQKIYKPLVTDVAENTTNIMEEYVQEDVDYTNFNILSDNYQRRLLKMGADGKGGIGVHSNAVTFEAQMQRLKPGSKVNIDDYYFNNDGEMETRAFTDTLGGYTFSGSLGANVKTLDGGRDISDQHGENQNVSTDNISKQIMGKRNENSYTMSVYAFMAHMGFDLTADNVNTGITDKDKKLIVERLHIPSLFINQPILRDYVRVRQKYESMSADYIKNKDLAIIEELAGLYGFKFNAEDYADSKKIVDDAKYQKISEGLNGQTLFNNLKEDIAKTNPDIQAVILDKFLKYQEKARQLSEVQQLINLSTSKLGVSYFETLQKIQKLNEITEKQIDANSSEFTGNNFTNLIGEYSTEPKEGFTKVGDYYWKPTTIEGKMLINSLSVANKTLPIFFPYNSDIINNMIESVFSVRDLDSSVKSKSNLRLKYEIMTEFVNYINSGSNVFSDNISNERKRLFFNSEGNQALGNIIKELKRLRHPIMQNSLLNDLTTKEDIITGIVKIEHTPDEQTTLDKSTKYEDFKNLLKDDTVLGIFNGEELRVSDLAQDLISYSLLSDDMNGAIGFRNYIPTDFFSIVGDNKDKRNLFSNISNNIDSQELEIMKDNFIRQYFQHNPERAVILKEEDFKTLKDSIANGTPVRKPRFVSIRNTAKSGEAKQWNMYEFNEHQNSYNAIDILGVPGTYNEYDSSISNKKSEISDNQSNTKVETNQYVVPKATNIDIKRFDTELQKITSIQDLTEIYSQNTNISERLRKLYSEILPYINNETKLIYDKKEPYAGYNLEENTISISTKFWEITFNNNNNNIERTREEVAETILEEILHSITINEVQKFVTSNESGDITVSEDAPIYIRNLANLYKIAREKVPYDKNNHNATYGSMNIEEFIANVFTNPEYRNSLENQQKGFIKEFLKAVRNMFRYLHWKTNGTYPKYDDVIFENVMEMLKDRGQSTISAEIKKKNIISEVKENNPVQQTERPLERLSQTEITNPVEQNMYRGLPVIDSTDIINAEGQRGAAQYDRTNNVIKVDKTLLQQKFNEKAWTKMRDLVETIHGEEVKSKAKDLPVDLFKTYEQFEAFVIEHEYQHSIYPKEQFDAENPGKTKGDYETAINERALSHLSKSTENYLDLQETAQAPQGVVQDLSGNTYSVNESDIITYETNFGPIRYITNENGDMVMLSSKNMDVVEAQIIPEQIKIEKSEFSYNGITIKTDFQLTGEQVNALERLIDFVENPNEDSIITLSGYAGTGKTSIIKYLERYKEAQNRGGTNFIYAAPTHAATVYLGLNIRELPFTVQSMVYEKFDPMSGTMKPVVTKKFENSLSIFANNVLVIDEASMIANKDLGNITGVMKRNDVKIIFMGDKAQLPEVSTRAGDKSISKVFTDYESIQLTEVKRTSDDSILGVLTEIRNNPDGKLPVAENTDTMQYVDTAMDFKRKAFQKIKEDPENTVFISYTNKGVQSFNSQVREGLGFTKGLQKGESIIGYGGYNSKKVEDGNLANSVKYTVENAEMVSTNEYKGMDIYFSSNILEKIPDTKSKGRTLYLPLNNSDVIPVDNLSNEDYQKNNEYISKQFRGLYSAKQRAKQTKRGQDWGMYYNELQKVSAFMQKVDLGADYVYNPATDKFEIPNSTHSKLLKDNPELKVGKGIDYGYAITVHKSQGATFDNVFFDASSVPANTAKLVENGKQVGIEGNSLLYVGMSRAAKNLTVLKGDNNKTITGNIVSLSDINKLPENKC